MVQLYLILKHPHSVFHNECPKMLIKILFIFLHFLSKLLSKACFTSEQFIFLFASTFKSNDSLSSTDEKQEKKNYKGFEKVKVILLKPHLIPKVCLLVNQAQLKTFSFTQLSAASACFTEQIVLVAN